MRIAHVKEEEEKAEKQGNRIPLYKDPVFMANLRREFIKEHNEKIRKQKANQR